MLAGAALLTAVTQFALNLIGELVIALGMGIGNAAVFKMVPKYVPEAVGGASGWVGGLGALGGFIIPPILGAFVDVLGPVGYARGFFVYVVLGVAATALAIAFVRAEKPSRPPRRAEGAGKERR